MRTVRSPAFPVFVIAALACALVLAGCPDGSSTPSPAPSASPPATSAPAAVRSASSGAIEVTVKDERGRPFEGAVVWVMGLKPSTPLPRDPVVLEQKDLEFRPPLLVARRGQTLEVRNADAELHNVHSQDPCCAWNVSVTSGQKDSRVLDAAGEALLLCNIHAHMRAELLILDADFVRSDASGKARLEGVPEGTWKVAVRALDRPRIELETKVPASGAASVEASLLPVAQNGRIKIIPPEELPWPVLAARVRASLEEAVRWASAGDAASAREAVGVAQKRWFSFGGDDLMNAIRKFDAESGIKEHRDRFSGLNSRIGKIAAQAEAAANATKEERPPLIEKLAAKVDNIATQVEDVARKLPKREPGSNK